MKKLLRLHAPDIAHREALLHRIERLTELPLLVLAYAGKTFVKARHRTM